LKDSKELAEMPNVLIRHNT